MKIYIVSVSNGIDPEEVDRIYIGRKKATKRCVYLNSRNNKVACLRVFEVFDIDDWKL